MDSGGGETKTTQQATSAPYQPTQPYIQDLLGKTSSMYDAQSPTAGQYAPFNTVVQPGAITQQGLDLTQQRALNGSPVTGAADSFLTKYLQSQSAPPGSSALQSLLSGYSNPGSAMTQAGAGANPYLSQISGQMGQQNAATGIASDLASQGPNMAGNRTLQASANGGMTNAANPLAAFYATQNPNANPSQANLGSMASGAEINPYIDSLYSAVSKPVIDQVNAQFGAAGRTGSGANQQLLTRDLGDLSAQVRAPAWQQAVQNQLAANGQVQGAFDNASGRNLTATGLLGQYSGQDIGNRLNSAQNLNSGNLAAYGAKGNAASLLGNLSGQDLSRNATLANQLAGFGESGQNRLLSAGGQLSNDAANQAQTIGNAANSLDASAATQTGQKLNASQLAPALANNDYTDLQNLLNVGGAQDSQQAAQIQDLLTRWQYQQQQPWNLLNNYSGLITGYAGLGGQTSGTGTQTLPKQSLLPQLIGGAAQIGGAAMMSDRRVKTRVNRIGTYPNGLPMYAYRYKGEKRDRVGLMAQDVVKVKPEAIVMRSDGMMAVNYDLALAA